MGRSGGTTSGGGIGSVASSSNKSGSLRPEQPLGSDGSSSSSSSSSVPSLHKQIDLANAAVGGDIGGGGAGAAIVSLVQTKPLSLQGFASPSHSLTSAAAANASPVFLMLADDNRVGGASTGGGSGTLGIGGAYAAQLVTINAKGNNRAVAAAKISPPSHRCPGPAVPHTIRLLDMSTRRERR